MKQLKYENIYNMKIMQPRLRMKCVVFMAF